MSEYQYYEFQAIDRRLTKAEMDELRAHSSRAKITPTSFINEYSWGDFKGDKDALMEKYFDAFLYLANWGTRIVKLRVPATLLNLETARQYFGKCVSAREKGYGSIDAEKSNGTRLQLLEAVIRVDEYIKTIRTIKDIQQWCQWAKKPDGPLFWKTPRPQDGVNNKHSDFVGLQPNSYFRHV